MVRVPKMLNKSRSNNVKRKSTWLNTNFGTSEDLKNESSDSDVEIVSDFSNNGFKKSSSTMTRSKEKPRLLSHVNLTARLNKGDLAVHKKKVEEVDDWLSKALCNSSREPKMLHMSGPTGAGKTTTIHVLAKSRNIEVVEWTNPMDDFNASEERYSGPSQASKFENFLIASARYNSVIDSHQSRKIIVIEDYPNVFLLKPELFHDVIRKYQRMGKSPLVFITTDVNSGKNMSVSLFSPQFISEINIQHIKFNPITNTSLVKALNNVLKTENWHVSSETINDISQACDGDIRHGILELIFLTQSANLKSNSLSKPVGRPMNRKRKADTLKGKSSAKNQMQKGLGSNGKDLNTGIMHSVGRTLHAKREKSVVVGGSLDFDKRGYLKTNPQEIIDQFTLQSHHFISLTHENYHSIFSDIHSAAKAAEYLCNADVITNEWNDKDLITEVGFSIAIRGVMNACLDPIQRWNPLQRSKWKEIKLERDENLRILKYSSSMTSFSSRTLCMDFAPFHDSNSSSSSLLRTVPVKIEDSSPASPEPHITDEDSD